jgi:chemotaxis-related protein WspB
MLFLLFDLDHDRYALDAREIVEVLALRPVRPIPGAPAWVAGVAQRHGAPLPVVDVAQLALGRPARQRLSTRLVIVRYENRAPVPHDGASNDGASGDGASVHLLGLIVESATQTRRIARTQFADTGIATPHARWLGPVASDGGTLVQWVQVQHMLSDEVKALLFVPAAPAHATSVPHVATLLDEPTAKHEPTSTP